MLIFGTQVHVKESYNIFSIYHFLFVYNKRPITLYLFLRTYLTHVREEALVPQGQ